MTENDQLYFNELLSRKVIWCRLIGGPKRGTVLEIPNDQHHIELPFLKNQPIILNEKEETEQFLYGKALYVRNCDSPSQFIYQMDT